MAYFALSNADGKKFPVYLTYWWPGRKYKDLESLSKEVRSLIKQCKRSDSKYLVYACTEVHDGKVFSTHARCMDIDKDNVRKRYGRDHALGLLQQELLQNGYVLVKKEDESNRYVRAI